MNEFKKKILIIGGDGLLGAQIARHLFADHIVVSTSRRLNAEAFQIYFDLNSIELSRLFDVSPNMVIICAGITNMNACEVDKDGSRNINVLAASQIASEFMDRGVPVVFLSSTAVFDGEAEFPDESHSYSPLNVYGTQKMEAERLMRTHPNANSLLCILRLTKVITRQVGIVETFATSLKAGKECIAFSDLYLCPISMPYLLRGISVLVGCQRPGIFHLSGSRIISYVDLARAMAEKMGVGSDMVISKKSGEITSKTIFAPKHPALGMRRTTELLGISPEPFEFTLERLFKHDY